jgi:hypothetical protein
VDAEGERKGDLGEKGDFCVDEAVYGCTQLHDLGNCCSSSPLLSNSAKDVSLPESCRFLAETDADLARVVEAWAGLLEPIRRAIMAMLDAAGR